MFLYQALPFLIILKLNPCLYEQEPSPPNPYVLPDMTFSDNSESTEALLVKLDNPDLLFSFLLET